MADTYAYLGDDERGYFAYVDTETETMLVAEPGKSYGIRATEVGYLIPPRDGRWEVPDETEPETPTVPAPRKSSSSSANVTTPVVTDTPTDGKTGDE